MPEVYGNCYPEIGLAGLQNNELNILFNPNNKVTDDYAKLIMQLCTLQQYLKDLPSPKVMIRIIWPGEFPPAFKIFNIISVDLLDINGNDPKVVFEAASKVNADIIVDNGETDEEIKKYEDSYSILYRNIQGTLDSTECFVRGHEIPWSFDMPIWNVPWSIFYSTVTEFGQQLCECYNQYITQEQDAQVAEIMQSLLFHRFANINYTRDKLQFYKIQRNFAKRVNWVRQSFKFELGYYFANYYLNLWGALDQIARIIKHLLGIEWKSKIGISLAYDQFVSKVREHSRVLYDLLKEDEFLKWMEYLKICRHHIAHQGSVVLRSIISEPKEGYDANEIIQAVNKRPEFIRIKSHMQDEIVEKYFQHFIKMEKLARAQRMWRMPTLLAKIKTRVLLHL